MVEGVGVDGLIAAEETVAQTEVGEGVTAQVLREYEHGVIAEVGAGAGAGVGAGVIAEVVAGAEAGPVAVVRGGAAVVVAAREVAGVGAEATRDMREGLHAYQNLIR